MNQVYYNVNSIISIIYYTRIIYCVNNVIILFKKYVEEY